MYAGGILRIQIGLTGIIVGLVKCDRGVVVHRVRVEPRKPVSSGGRHFLKQLQSP